MVVVVTMSYSSKDDEAVAISGIFLGLCSRSSRTSGMCPLHCRMMYDYGYKGYARTHG